MRRDFAVVRARDRVSRFIRALFEDRRAIPKLNRVSHRLFRIRWSPTRR
jgi:hypothetical protein